MYWILRFLLNPLDICLSKKLLPRINCESVALWSSACNPENIVHLEPRIHQTKYLVEISESYHHGEVSIKTLIVRHCHRNLVDAKVDFQTILCVYRV